VQEMMDLENLTKKSLETGRLHIPRHRVRAARVWFLC